MGKADFLSPKAISNRIKAKGLQKLRWYCQMCQKQCRDENGFKCHCMSKSHQRQLLLASENPNQFMDYFSDEFKSDFLKGTKRVHNNIIYNEYISNREHVHMNSTQWETLTEFTKWLGREGFCKVDETPKGWYVQYIDRDPKTIRKQEEQERKKKQDLDDEERRAKFIEEQVRRGREGKEPEERVFKEFKRKNDEKIFFTWAARSSSAGPAKASTPLVSNALKSSASGKRKDTSHSADSKQMCLMQVGVKLSIDNFKDEVVPLAECSQKMTAMEAKKKKSVKLDNWIRPDIVVKVVTKRLGDKYYKKKAVIREVQDKYTAIVKLIDSGDKLKLDQSHLETVIPAPGKRVIIVNGPYRDMEAILEGIDEQKFSAQLTIDSGALKGKRVDGIPYEDFSKEA
ncbi:DNA/RNA-binding protein KIN17-like [Clarias gariepinus]